MELQRKLLWVDDDDKRRFAFEEMLLKRNGLDVQWAHDISSALRRLSGEEFDAVILDQALPFYRKELWERTSRESVWGGCVVLHWLRGKEPPPQAEGAADKKVLRQYIPKGRNAQVQVLIVSGFFDEELERVTHSASSQDQDLKICPKPLDLNELLGFIGEVT